MESDPPIEGESKPRRRVPKGCQLPAELRPEDVVAICDSREQWPLDLSPLKMQRGTLVTADYSVLGLEHFVVAERKTAEDMLACVGRERERFDKEVKRLLAYPARCLFIEAGWQFFERGEWRGDVTPNMAIGSLLGWITSGLPICMCYDHERCGRYVSRFLFTAARRRWREARSLVSSIIEGESA